MPAPFVSVFDVGGLKVASIVIDEPEFNALVDECYGKGLFAPEMVSATKNAKNIPLVVRGAKTDFIFTRYGVKAEISKCGVIVRGAGMAVAAAHGL